MIVAVVSDPLLRATVRRAARPDEDVVWEEETVLEALQKGYPRLAVKASEDLHPLARSFHRIDEGIPALCLTRATLRAWESDRRAKDVPPARVEHDAGLLRSLIRREALRGTWVDRLLGELSRATGSPLPEPLKGMVRRVLEFPAHYEDLHSLAALSGLSRGALKARFRRRGLSSPSQYLRWLRVIAAAHVLAEPSVTICQASVRMGCTSPGNFCRAVRNTTGLAPSRIRSAEGRLRLLLTFVRDFLDRASLEAWSSLDELFLRRSA